MKIKDRQILKKRERELTIKRNTCRRIEKERGG